MHVKQNSISSTQLCGPHRGGLKCRGAGQLSLEAPMTYFMTSKLSGEDCGECIFTLSLPRSGPCNLAILIVPLCSPRGCCVVLAVSNIELLDLFPYTTKITPCDTQNLRGDYHTLGFNQQKSKLSSVETQNS